MPALKSCPRCKKRFKDEATMLNHMHQPRSRCRIRHEELLEMSRLQKASRTPYQITNILAPADDHQPSSSNTQPGNARPDGSSYPNNIESNTQPYHTGIYGFENDVDMLAGDPLSDHDDHDLNPPADTSNHYYIDEYPGLAIFFDTGMSFMDKFDADQYLSERKENLYYPFTSRDEWELVSYLLRSSLSMAAIDKFLKLSLV